ncbi:MAG TPA: type IV secretory system conjugative DNA transfer family protein [Bryobacteraceae bacterium]|jgi:type IV secretion system protein VirD4|nr:type IV secretory system conjugative DNA transfer family protein [Bryobacteraceae bacterium]
MKIRIGLLEGKPLYYPGNAHGILCAPARRGKFSCILAQILMTWLASLFVLDPKGQAAMTTGRYRRDVLGQEVVVLNPFNIEQEALKDFTHAQYCPVTGLDPKSDTFAADADSLAEGLLPYTGHDKHWIDSARPLVAGVIMYLRSTMDRWSLADVYTIVCDPHLFAFCEDALKEDIDELIRTRLGRFAGESARENREIRSIVSAAITGLAFIGNKPIANNLRRSTTVFNMKKKAKTIYVILPTKYAISCAPWMRTITNEWANACLTGGPDVPVLGILQEFATSVGNLNSIDTLNVMGAGHGCQIISEFQDLNQLKNLKPNGWQTYLANAGFQIYMATGKGDLFTSDHLSRMTGQIEVPSVSRSINDGQGQSLQMASGIVDSINRGLRNIAGGNGAQVSIGSRQRPYLLPEEISELDATEMLVFAEDVRGVIRAGRKHYFQDPEFAGRYDADPYHAKRP